MKWGRVAVIGAAVLIAGGGIWWAFSPQPRAVDTAVVETGDLIVTVDEEGFARIRDVYEISTPVHGELLRIPVQVGDAVEAGEVVATIVPQESALLDPRSRAEAEAVLAGAEDAVLSAQSELTLAQSELSFWQTEADRKEQLLEKGVATLQTFQQAQLELKRPTLTLGLMHASTSEQSSRQLEFGDDRRLHLRRRTGLGSRLGLWFRLQHVGQFRPNAAIAQRYGVRRADAGRSGPVGHGRRIADNRLRLAPRRWLLTGLHALIADRLRATRADADLAVGTELGRRVAGHRRRRAGQIVVPLRWPRDRHGRPSDTERRAIAPGPAIGRGRRVHVGQRTGIIGGHHRLAIGHETIAIAAAARQRRA